MYIWLENRIKDEGKTFPIIDKKNFQYNYFYEWLSLIIKIIVVALGSTSDAYKFHKLSKPGWVEI